MNQLDEAYRKYQLLWCAEHGYSVEGIIDIVVDIVNDMIEGDFIKTSEVVESFNERAFYGEMFACKEEFKDCEYQEWLESLNKR